MNYEGRRIGPQPLIGYYDTRFLWHQISKQKKKVSWLILNQKIALKEIALSGAEHNPAIRDKNTLGLLKGLFFGQKDLIEEMKRSCPDFITANSVSELAVKMNDLAGSDDVNSEKMAADIQQYDSQIDRGPKFFNDDQLRRIAHLRRYRGDRIRTCNFQKIVDPKAFPLIAIRCHILVRKSLGGIQTDLESRVINSQGEAIPGLYAVGEAAGFGGGGSNGKRSLEGLFVSNCILTGRMAARSIAGVRDFQ
jgi:predicted oxidoreductase